MRVLFEVALFVFIALVLILGAVTIYRRWFPSEEKRTVVFEQKKKEEEKKDASI